MIEIVGTAQHEAWAARVLPPVEQVAPLVWSVPVPCPFAVRHTFAYLLADDAGQFVVVDPGWDSEAGREQLLAGIAAAGLEEQDLEGVVVTHAHPDHVAMVPWLAARTGAWVGMHPAEADDVARRPREEQVLLAVEHSWLVECGVPAETLPELLPAAGSLAHVAARPAPSVLLEDGQRLPLPGRDLQVLLTPGHTAGHLAVVDADNRLLLTGDHVLPRISPNVGLGPHDRPRDALGEYLAALERVSAYDAFTVCPGHEFRFRGLAERCAELREHHAVRTREVAGLLRDPAAPSTWQIAERLSWSRGWANLDGPSRRLALAATAAQVRHLRGHRATARSAGAVPGPSGQAVASSPASAAARPASSRATGTRKGEQET